MKGREETVKGAGSRGKCEHEVVDNERLTDNSIN